MSMPASYFDKMFAASEDPWAFRERWYEKRKRDLTLASLLRQQYQRVFEPGCANGELSLALAERSVGFLGLDICERAVALARARLAQQTAATVNVGQVPEDWPAGSFDLIVLSELGYYLDEQQWVEVIKLAQRSLRPRGTLLACHWLHPIEGCPMTGAQVHQLLNQHVSLHRNVRHEEADFVLEVWSSDLAPMRLQEQVS